jgi:hypothetical protein
MVAQAGNQPGKEVRPEDKMSSDSQNDDIINLSARAVHALLAVLRVFLMAVRCN